MTLDRSSALYHSIPAIATVGVLALVFVLAAVYFWIIYPIQKRMTRKKRALAEKADDPTSLDTLGAPRRNLHRWVPALPTPSTPGSSPASFRSNHNNYSFSIRSLSASPSSRATASPSPNNLTEFPVTPTVAATLTPPPSAMIGERAAGWSSSQHRSGQDPFADPGPSYVGKQGSPRQSPVAVPAPSADVLRHSADSTSTATYSTLPPSYRTHRYTTYGTTPYTQFQNDANPTNLSQTTTGEPGQSSRPPRSARRSRHPKKSMDGGVRIDGGLPDDTPTQGGAARPPKYRERKKF